MDVQVTPVHGLQGCIRVPGDKSIAHRALMLNTLAHGTARLWGVPGGRDIRSTIRCLRRLGAHVEVQDRAVIVRGQGPFGWRSPDRPLDCGNSGTTMRLLAGLLAGQPLHVILTGDASLRRRPMRRIIEPLTRMGADITSADGEHPPLTIRGQSLHGIHYTLPIASAQVKSCILFAGLYADGVTVVNEPVPSRDHSERMLQCMGARIHWEADRIVIQRSLHLTPWTGRIPGDISSAAYWIAAATLVPGSTLRIDHVGWNPTRTGFVEILKQMGGVIELLNVTEINGEPRADILVRSASLRGIHIEGAWIPRTIDELPLLAVIATQAEGTTTIRDARELRVKESDRIHSTVTNLRRLGARVEELPDGMVIEGPTRLHGGVVDAYGDHRIAMAFAVAGLIADAPVTIQGAEWAEVSYPGFFDTLRALSHATP